ncbi:MAG: hypothetical protein JNJ83_00665 [Verrucomicrobiaceae bacterium]|nr:hypothetical protein [Verrucomicrobiaceae bacterium]
MSAPIPTRLRALWHKLPFPEMSVLVLALFIIKEQFPFSNFPMYSNISEEADVVYVSNQNDEPLAMKSLFRTSSGTSKKKFNTELKKLTNPSGRNSEDATLEERQKAGKVVLDALMADLERKAIPAGTVALRFHRRTFRAGDGGVGAIPSEMLAEVNL